jgi:dTDP-4-dehydrorhamnose reductase
MRPKWNNLMKLLIIGASGYIGRQLHNWAIEDSTAIGTSTVASSTTLKFRLDAPTDFEYGIIHRSDVVLLAAAISSPDVCSRAREHAWAVNVTGTSLFISQVIARGARVIFFSSDAVYGEKTEEFDESAACNPTGDYAEMKHEVERIFLGNPAFKAIRLSYVFSKEDQFTKYLFKCCERGEEAEIYHPFDRAVVCRDDVVQGAIALARHWEEFPQSALNFGGPDVISRIKFAQIFRDGKLPALRFRQIEPNPAFFANRPRVIRMKSPLLELLLGRPARSLREATQNEFGDQGNEQND